YFEQQKRRRNSPAPGIDCRELNRGLRHAGGSLLTLDVDRLIATDRPEVQEQPQIDKGHSRRDKRIGLQSSAVPGEARLVNRLFVGWKLLQSRGGIPSGLRHFVTHGRQFGFHVTELFAVQAICRSERQIEKFCGLWGLVSLVDSWICLLELLTREPIFAIAQ